MVSLPNPDVIVSMRHWNSLPEEDRATYLKMRSQFLNQVKSNTKDRRCLTFSKEVLSILAFVDSSPENREERSIVSGLVFAGPFICVNTRQLKAFIGRCKSSINGSFQQVGYLAVRTKAKAKECVSLFLPSLHNDPGTLRQWTVRYCSNCVFMSRFLPPEMPQISEDDLYEDKKKTSAAIQQQKAIQLEVKQQQQQQEQQQNQSQNQTNLHELTEEEESQTAYPIVVNSPIISPESPLSADDISSSPQALSPPTVLQSKPIMFHSHKQSRRPKIPIPDNANSNNCNNCNCQQHQKFNFDLSCFHNSEAGVKIPDLKPSFSVDYLSIDGDDWEDMVDESPLSDVSHSLTRSQSSSPFCDWSWQQFL